MACLQIQPGPLLAAAFAMVFTATGVARAESALRLPYPSEYGKIAAATYDTDHNRVGDAHILIEKVDGGRVRMTIESGIDDGPHTVATAELEPVDGGALLQLVKQESRSTDAAGVDLGILKIDHENAVASCEKGGSGDMKTQLLMLPELDRVANVPLNLLFQPLVAGDSESMSFQLLICRFGARLVDIDAHVVSRPGDGQTANRFVEIESQPNFGKFVSFVAGNLMPRLSFWFDPRRSSPWIAHRVPLYSKGPEVFVIRDTVAAAWLASRD
jgi:hypothetical protein